MTLYFAGLVLSYRLYSAAQSLLTGNICCVDLHLSFWGKLFLGTSFVVFASNNIVDIQFLRSFFASKYVNIKRCIVRVKLWVQLDFWLLGTISLTFYLLVLVVNKVKTGDLFAFVFAVNHCAHDGDNNHENNDNNHNDLNGNLGLRALICRRLLRCNHLLLLLFFF